MEDELRRFTALSAQLKKSVDLVGSARDSEEVRQRIAAALARGKPGRVTPVTLDVFTEGDRLDALVAAHDLVVSLVPAPCHPAVARHAISHHRNMVTASYVSPEMAALHEAAAAAGIVILNETGLDPGIDHMSAMALIDAARARGGVITTFSSGA